MIQNLNIAVVDDDPTLLDLLSTYLASDGHRPVACESASECLKHLEHHTVDLVISDVAMAEMDGFELVRRIRALYPEVGIVMMTAFGSEYPLATALRAGADGYITKPFTLQKFSLIFEEAFWKALSRQDWWEAHDDGQPSNAYFEA